MSEEMPEVRLVGVADGPRKFVPTFGLEVATFSQEPPDGKPALSFHVPLNLRGPFRPDQLANFDPEKVYRVDNIGYALCLSKTKKDELCNRKAMNRWPRCEMHGGRLHPLDRLQADTGELETQEPMSRYQLFLAKQLTVEDLDDEEIMAMGFRRDNGVIFKPKNIPRAVADQFTRAIFDRSLDKLKVSALAAAQTLESIMLDTAVDASVRLRAATEILDRTVGKAATNVNITASKPFELIFDAISAAPPQEILDAEIVEQQSLTRPGLPPDVELPGAEQDSGSQG